MLASLFTANLVFAEEKLEEVVVTATRTQQTKEKAPTQVEVITSVPLA